MKTHKRKAPTGCKRKLSAKESPDKGGRPTLLTSVLQDRICRLIAKDDMYVERACCLVGVSKQNYYNWLKWGADDKEPYAGFFDAVKRAEAQAQLNNLRDMKKNARYWAMYQTRLERRFPDEWGRRERVHQEHSGGLEIILKVSESNGNGDAPTE